jgi:hypothetical protein
MSSAGAAPCAVPAINPRAEASRRNGAKSCGPKSPEGKARSAQNALKHGFRAKKHVVLDDEDAAEFAALEAALIEELAPQGALQVVLARRLAAAAWRLSRADRIESELLGRERRGDGDLARGVIRDGHGARVLPTLLRYRGAAMAELMRSLRALKALQAEARAAGVDRSAACERKPDEPESRANPSGSGESGEACHTCDRADAIASRRDPGLGLSPPWPLPAPDRAAPHAQPIEPELQQPGGLRPAAPYLSQETEGAPSRESPAGTLVTQLAPSHGACGRPTE